MDDKPKFDLAKASFFLVAGILTVECLVVLSSVISCVWFSRTIITNPDIVCDPNNRMMELLTGALAAALAFAAGVMRGKGDDDKP